jgi:hypothetical protein
MGFRGRKAPLLLGIQPFNEVLNMTNNVNLNHLRTPKDYISDGRTHIFPSEASLLWFIRKNKKLLIQSNALLCPTGRTLIDSSHFDEVVYEVGTHKFRTQ